MNLSSIVSESPSTKRGFRASAYLGHLASSELGLGKFIYGDVGNRQIEIRQSPVRIDAE